MSYYEWINNFEMLQTSPMDDNILKHLEKQTIYQNDYIRIKLFRHILNTINTRLNNIGYKCLDRVYSNAYDVDTLSLDFINLKKEEKFVLKISKLPVFDNEAQIILRENIDKRYTNICNMLRKHINNVDTEGNCIMAFEKIMSSNMEG